MSTPTTRIDVALIPVSDQDKAIAWYTQVLGFELRADQPFGKGDRWVEVAPAGSVTRLALMPPRNTITVGSDSRVLFGSSDIDATHAQLKSRGVDMDEQVMRMGDPIPPMFSFRDLDGNAFMYVQTMAD